jgi:hypothetical protein
VSAAKAAEKPPTLVWDMATREVCHRLDAPPTGVLTGAWRGDGRMLMIGAALDGLVRAWDLSGESPRSTDLRVIRPGLQWLTAIALTPEGRHVVVGHPRGPALVFRLAPRGRPFDVATAAQD